MTHAPVQAIPEYIVAGQSPRREMHVICDKVSTHTTPLVQAVLARKIRVRTHYTLTYSLWLNPPENLFTRIHRDVITRGVFTSVNGHDKKLMRCIRQYNTDLNPLKSGHSPTPIDASNPILQIQWTGNQ